MVDVSILIPHYQNGNGNRVLAATLPHLIQRTTLSYELVVTAHVEREFIAWNDMARRARSEWLVFMVSDQFVAPGWDVALWNARDAHLITTLNVVESGYYPTPDFSLVHDFGRTPETFDADAFDAYAAMEPDAPDCESWAFPWLVHRDVFISMGGFRLDRLPSGLTEMYFWEDWRKAGKGMQRVNGYSYHLVAWTLTGEGR